MTPVYDKLLTSLVEMANIDRFDIELVQKVFEPIEARKGQVLEQPGRTVKYLYFVNSGFVRVYYFRDGDEVTGFINCPHGFMTSFHSFITGTQSHEFVECITDCSLLRITKKDLDTLYRHSQKWAEIGRVIYEKSLAYNEQRTKDILTLSAEQRYLKLMAEQPDILQNVPLQYIASFIGIKPESLSRIRRQIIS